MALMANVMMTGAESSGCLLGIPEDVMGLTVTAAGTSLPNLFASLMVAKRKLLALWITRRACRQFRSSRVGWLTLTSNCLTASDACCAAEGLGNMAVSNAFGSNTFNIFVALAVPWLIGTIIHGQSQLCPSMEGNFYTYHVTAGKIGQSCAILGAVLAMMVSAPAAALVATAVDAGFSPALAETV